MAAEMARRSDEAEAKLAREPRMSVSDHVDRVCEVDMKKRPRLTKNHPDALFGPASKCCQCARENTV